VAVALSLMEKPSQAALRVDLRNIDYSTSGGFNAAALIVVGILVALYAVWW
jgi:SSS family solute:Na+ symporter